jgi:hypothetical protein
MPKVKDKHLNKEKKSKKFFIFVNQIIKLSLEQNCNDLFK